MYDFYLASQAVSNFTIKNSFSEHNLYVNF